MNKKRLKILFFALIFAAPFLNSNTYALNLDRLKISFLEGNYKEAIAEGEKLIATAKHSSDVEELYYLLGLAYLKEGNYLRASDIFEIIINEFKDGKFHDEAAIGLGDAYFLKQDLAKAQSIYEKMLQDKPQTKYKAGLYFRLSQIGFKNGQPKQAQEYLEKLKKEYPQNPNLLQDKDTCIVYEGSSACLYTVQVGSFSNIKNAQGLTQKLINQGYKAFIEEADLQGKSSYRVRVGRLATLQEARNLEKELKGQGYPTKIYP